MKRYLRPISLLLIPLLVLCSFPTAVTAQTGEELDPVQPAPASSSSDDTTQAILVGLLVVIVSVVFILGLKSDFGGSKWSKNSEMEETYAEMVKNGELDTSAFAPPELGTKEYELVLEE